MWWKLALSCSVLSGMWVIPLSNIAHPLVTQQLCVYQIDCPVITLLVFKSPSFYLIIDPTRKSNNAGNLNMPKRSHNVLSLKEKVKILDLIRKGKKNCMLRWLRSMLRINLLSMKLWRRKKKSMLVLLLYFKLQKLWPQCASP